MCYAPYAIGAIGAIGARRYMCFLRSTLYALRKRSVRLSPDKLTLRSHPDPDPDAADPDPDTLDLTRTGQDPLRRRLSVHAAREDHRCCEDQRGLSSVSAYGVERFTFVLR